LETLKDILESVRDWFRTRFTNPLFAAFIVAWLTMNWRVVLALLSDVPYTQKISWLDKNLYPAWWHWPAYGFVFPMAVALAYVVVSPPIFRVITTYYRKQQHKSAAALLLADAVKPLSPEEGQRLLKERVAAKVAARAAAERFTAAESDYIDQIAKLQAALDHNISTAVTSDALPKQVEEPQAVGDGANKQWRFTASDFDIADMSHVEKLLSRGLTQDEANFLFAVKGHIGSPGFIPWHSASPLVGFDSFRANLVTGRLKNLNLVRDGVPQSDDAPGEGRFLVTEEGMQAADALMRRGFKPDLKPPPAPRTSTVAVRPATVGRPPGPVPATEPLAQRYVDAVSLLANSRALTGDPSVSEAVRVLAAQPKGVLDPAVLDAVTFLGQTKGLIGDLPMSEAARILGSQPKGLLDSGISEAAKLRDFQSKGLLGPAISEAEGLLGAQRKGLLGGS
jgi:hypothetical protein